MLEYLSWSTKEKAAEAAGGIEKPRSTYYFCLYSERGNT